MSTKTLGYTCALLTFFTLLLMCSVQAQFQANFTLDKPGGCSPLSIQFTNTTTGATATTTYQWSFGNGNSSTITSPGATYYDEKTYTVTLTAKDGATTSTKTQQVTVYKKPTVDFGVTPAKGCVPLATVFSSTATPGDGTISKYYWDFGDGGTEQGTNATATHMYTFPQKPPTSLTVTNSFGCYTTSTKTGMVEAVKAVTASFTTSTNSLCNPGDEVTFTNTSTGSGTLTYAWSFGDGKTSTEQSPKHAFTSKGSFIITLKVTSSDGCSMDAPSTTINVANFIADVDVPVPICQNQQFNFSNKSTAGYDNIEWFIDNNSYGSYNYNILPYTFYDIAEHTIKLVAKYGKCDVSVSKKINVNPIPMPNGFIANLEGACGAPVTINFKDTTTGAVKWEWRQYYFSNTIFSTSQSPSYTYTSGGHDWVYLTVTNKEGCSSTTSQYIYFDKPNVNIQAKSTTGMDPYMANCKGITVEFTTFPDTLVKDFKWNFGDGTTSTEKEPKHTFDKEGSFTTTLDYTTVNGCKGTTSYHRIMVVDKPKFDFAVVGSTTICGNTPTTFNATPAVSGWEYFWNFNDEFTWNYSYANVVHQFKYDTIYTAQLIAANGYCRDTITKKNYLTVLPPFPKISEVINTCDDTRGTVTFKETSYKAQQWSWDFGDGSKDSYSTLKEMVPHTYTKTGTYKVVLSTTNGACTVKDSTTAYVLLKQKPTLSATKSDACGSDAVQFQIKGYEQNPYREYNYLDFWLKKAEYSDFTPITSSIKIDNNNYYSSWIKEAPGTIKDLQSGKNDFRIISVSTYFNCEDTTNFIPLKVHGPTAGFQKLPHSGCFKEPVLFKDTSHTFSNVPISTWEWNFGDNTTQTSTTGGTMSHTYKTPGYYYITLTVTDADGCKNTTNYYDNYIQVDGPKADFSASSYNVAPNTDVTFYNTSQAYDYYYSQLKWVFPDGSESTNDYPTYNFVDEGKYDVKLITRSSLTGCPDTAIKTITVRKVNSVFTYTLSYINNNSCPPVMARFTSISTNYVRLAWDFGDGGVGGDQQIVSHTYNEAGLYRVVHYSYDANNAVDSTEDFIEIKGPYALIKADTLYACNTLQVRLTAEVKYAKDYTWDFGDGTLIAGTETFATHNYLTPGIYIPALILKDEGGCTTTSQLPDRIIVDSLSVNFSTVPAAICNAATVVFTPQTSSLSADNLQTQLQYRWIINEATIKDTSYNQFASHNFSVIGEHNVLLQVSSPYGCIANTSDKVDVKPGVKAAISGPLQICKDALATFTGSSTPTGGTLQWTWNFGNNNSSNVQNPPAQRFSVEGPQPISLIVSNGNCADTAHFILPVQEIPTISINPSQPILCLGDSMALTASGADTYQWATTHTIKDVHSSTAIVWPNTNTFYTVKGTNTFGCSSQDSVEVKVITPLQLTVKSPLFACVGNTVQLNAAGADKYVWQNGTALNNVNIANPISSTTSAINYTVVGYDNYNCFTDTATVVVKIGTLPTVNGGPDHQIIAGTQVKLNTTSSSDVRQWQWQPADFLDCNNCPSPTSTPKNSTVYEVTVYNSDGCFAKDTVRIELICQSDLVYIPTGFTPNGDNLNDRFSIHGSGIKSIRHFVIFDRWGKTVFERKNAHINDRNSSWDGKYNGEALPSAAYVYMIEVECDGGDVFTYKGTVTLIR
jgi:gliding motility-associated-like protein